jgi:lipopolysaccharide export LptBFGC system permease protein LptF
MIMKRIVLFFVVFLALMFASSVILGSDDTESLFIRLLFSGLIASIVFWLMSVSDEQQNTDNY